MIRPPNAFDEQRGFRARHNARGGSHNIGDARQRIGRFAVRANRANGADAACMRIDQSRADGGAGGKTEVARRFRR
ncbi:hypothetical protein [Elstera litoralis]|uniref:hypothetical protein n=1 Tax=Elstera litoralis TaxID=552518 RepID=UPI001E2AF079|nr:hypothetical protein [Elstera litoralis]